MEYRSFVPDLEVRQGGDGRTVRGIVVPYGQPTQITNDLTEEFGPGVIAHQFGATSRIKFARDHLPLGGVLIGRGVDGVWRDDAAGLYGELRVSKTPIGDETLELIRDGALDELSIGFEPVNAVRKAGNVTLRTKVNMFEVASVLAGAFGRGAVVTGVRTKLNRAFSVGDTDEDDAAAAAMLRVHTPGLDMAAAMLAGLPELPPAPAETQW